MQLSDFKPKYVPGLYLFYHFEAENGAFIQVHVRGDYWVYRNAQGEIRRYTDLEELKHHLVAENY